MVSYSEAAKTKAIRKALKEFEKHKMANPTAPRPSAPKTEYVKPKKTRKK